MPTRTARARAKTRSFVIICVAPARLAQHRSPAAHLDSGKSSLYNAPRLPLRPSVAQVAQLVEHCTENAGVGGSIPPLGTNSINSILILLGFLRRNPTTGKPESHPPLAPRNSAYASCRR